MAAFLIAFLVWLFAKDKYPAWIALASNTGNKPAASPAHTNSSSSSNNDETWKNVGAAVGSYFGGSE